MRLQRRRAALGVGLAAAFAASAGLAGAQGGGSPPITVKDAAGDVRSPLDIRRFVLGRSSDGRLRASITLAAAWEDSDLLAGEGPPGSVCVRVWTMTDPPDEPPTYLVCATATDDEELRGSVLRERANQLPERVAAAAVSRPTARTVTLRFLQTSIGRPSAIDASAETSRAGCPRVSCIDTAPDAPATQRLRLRKPASTNRP